ncbi:MAG: DUF4956 domain-containing protein [Actinobacteria bacterium]|nr:DUF4956 domain-containing protein [Actinomycetota bacterium]
MNQVVDVGIDLAAILILTLVVYFPRYRRPDMVIAFLGLNVGVMAVAVALSSTTTLGAGFGLGLFGTLSIIRLRSAELGQQEIAFYFSSLALGLIGGVEIDPAWLSAVLPIAIIAVMYIGDHPRLFRGYRHQVITLDHAITDEAALIRRLEEVLRCKVRRFEVRKIDLVNDTTTVDVRYKIPDPVAGT